MLVVVQRIPANIIATKNNAERYQRRSPPAAVTVVLTTRAPCPVVVVVDPTAVVIRCPAPRFLAHPGPAIRRNPGPVTITIWGPVVVAVDCGRARMPNPAVVGRVGPVAIGIQIFTTPNVTVVVLRVITQSLGQITLAFLDPVIPGVGSVCGDKLPITSFVTFDHKLCGASIAQFKPRGLGIDSGAHAIAGAQTHQAVARDVNAVEALFL